MIVPDVNLLLYAYDSASSHHRAAARWWEASLNGEERIGLVQAVLFAFVRLATSPRVFSNPLRFNEASAHVDEWLQYGHVSILEESPTHVQDTLDLVRKAGGSGSLLTDAQIAHVALDHGATVFTNDSDFQRFPGLQIENPTRR